MSTNPKHTAMKNLKNKKSNLEKMRGLFFQAGLLIAGGLTFLAFEWTTPITTPILSGVTVVDIEDPYVVIPDVLKKIERPEVKIEQPKVDPNTIVIVPNKTVIAVVEPTPEPVVVEPIGFDPDEWKTPEVVIEKDPIFRGGIEKMPEFIGGEPKMFIFLRDNIKYPKFAKRNGIEGKVYITFVVGKSGKIRNIKIKRGANKLLDDEAIRVIEAMPDWMPGKQHGKPVSVEYMIPINFALK